MIAIEEKLQEFGFKFVTPEMVNRKSADKQTALQNLLSDSADFNEFYDVYFAENKWVLPIEGGRRGQQYYLLWDAENPNQLTVDSTAPDGLGCEAILPVDLIVSLAPFLGVQKMN